VAANWELRGREMVNVFIGFGLLLITLTAAVFLAYYFFPAAFPVFWRQANVPNQGVIKRDWVATGRIDFATSITKVTSNPEDHDQPTEFKLLVEERRIVESLAGNENLEVQWRLATLRGDAPDFVEVGEAGIAVDHADPPPLKWSDLRYVFDIKEDCNGKEAIQA
jgi:hypothetical protein